MNQISDVTHEADVQNIHLDDVNHTEDDSQFDDVPHSSDANSSHSASVTHQEDASDLRLAPNPRKNIMLWQIYLCWNDLVKMRVRHTNRLKSIERGKSDMIAEVEQDLMELFQLDRHIKPRNKKERFGLDSNLPFADKAIFQLMIEAGQEVGLIWDWLTDIKGIGESLAAQILAQIDDINRFDSVAKLWRYCGYGIYEYWVDEKGKAICPREGWKWTSIGGERYRVWTICQVSDVTQSENAQNQSDNVTQDDNENSHILDATQGNFALNSHLADETQRNNVQSSQITDVTQYTYAIPQNSELPPIERIDHIEPNPEWKLVKLSDRLTEHYHSPFNRVLKSILWNTSDMFIKHQTPLYSDLYYAEKKRLRGLYPEKMKVNGKWKYNDGHISNMALRKTRKEFLKNLWLKWREFEGLPVE